MIDPEFWRLLVTISATMIGLVFLGTIYYLESGWEEYDIYRREMESLTVHGAQLLIAYFSTVLVLSLLQEPFLPTGVTTLAFVVLAIAVIVVTRAVNAALRAFEAASPDEWDSMILRTSRVSHWIAFVGVFIAPPAVVRVVQSAGAAGGPLSLTDLSIAWIVLLALFFGYWNLVQFLLLPYEVRRQERELAQEADAR